jgi:hypothetical protein
MAIVYHLPLMAIEYPKRTEVVTDNMCSIWVFCGNSTQLNSTQPNQGGINGISRK